MAAAAEKLDGKAELLSISEIAKRLKLDRATVRTRLEDLGYQADESSTPKLQLYAFDDEMEFAIKAAKDTLAAMKIRQLRAAAVKLEMQNAQARGELVPIHEATDFSQRLVKTIYEEIVVRQPKRIAGQLTKAKTQAAVRKILKTDMDRIMKNLRTNFERFLDG
jgi:hypothetical protein